MVNGAPAGVSRQVGPYTLADDPVLLGEYAQSIGRRTAREEHQQLARLGTDRGYEICADPQGTVRAVLLDYDEPSRFVNSSPESFAQCLQFGVLDGGRHQHGPPPVLGCPRDAVADP